MLSNRINSLPASATLAMAAKARELKNQGINVIGLSLGEPDFNTPEFIKEAAIQAVKTITILTLQLTGMLILKVQSVKSSKETMGCTINHNR